MFGLYKLQHFNPRSHTGSDLFRTFTGFCVGYFNPRSHTGSDYISPHYFGIKSQFQSTLPHGERRTIIDADPAFLHFNPRSHTGSDYYMGASLADENISIPAPTRGATFEGLFGLYTAPDFNPRSHTGSDAAVVSSHSKQSYFNPRSHTGSDFPFCSPVF